MADRYAEVSIAGVWLSADGTADAPKSRCEVQNESAFASPFTVIADGALDGTVHAIVSERGLSGIPFSVRAPYASETVIASIVAAMTTALAASGTVRVVVASQTSFDVQAMPTSTDGGALYSFESRSGGIARGVTFSFISTGAGGS